MEPGISVIADNISKKFGLSLRQSLKYGLKDMAQAFLGMPIHNNLLRVGEFWSVRDVSFVLKEGESLGIMGVNGSGKSTLLRMLNGVYSPDTGDIQIRGRVAALIAAGAGFAPMMSGRENIYINGSLMGLTKGEIDRLVDDIIDFSELEQFIDLPVRNYSSGMFVRLGFAIAALSRPDVLLMDEVLAVGDLNFQKKCFDHILRLKHEGTAIILVSHSPGAIWSVCDRGLFIDRGHVRVDGTVEDVIRAYEDQNSRNAFSAKRLSDRKDLSEGSIQPDSLSSNYGHDRGGTGEVICSSIKFLNGSQSDQCIEFDFKEQMLIESEIMIKVPQENLLLRFTVDAMHYRFIATLDSLEQGLELPFVQAGRYRLRVRVRSPNFRPGAYVLNMGISTKSVGVHLFYWFGAARFVIKHPPSPFLYSDSNAVMHLDSEFSLQELSAMTPGEVT
jgi:lipopolysaccharide transport system ATP-binding protein